MRRCSADLLPPRARVDEGRATRKPIEGGIERSYMELIYVIRGPARARASIEHRPAFLSPEIYLCITFCPRGSNEL